MNENNFIARFIFFFLWDICGYLYFCITFDLPHPNAQKSRPNIQFNPSQKNSIGSSSIALVWFGLYTKQRRRDQERSQESIREN